MLMLLSSLACLVLPGNGDVATVKRNIQGSFQELAVFNIVNVRWTASTSDHVGAALTCDRNLMAHIDTEVSDGVLRVTTPSGTVLEPTQPCELVLTSSCLEALRTSASGSIEGAGEVCAIGELETSGSGSISLEALESTALVIEVSGSGGMSVGEASVGELTTAQHGSGDVDLAGACDELEAELTASGNLWARSLSCETADITSSGSGDVELTVSDSALVSSSGSGDVDLWGGAEVESSSSGTGTVTSH